MCNTPRRTGSARVGFFNGGACYSHHWGDLILCPRTRVSVGPSIFLFLRNKKTKKWIRFNFQREKQKNLKNPFWDLLKKRWREKLMLSKTVLKRVNIIFTWFVSRHRRRSGSFTFNPIMSPLRPFSRFDHSVYSSRKLQFFLLTVYRSTRIPRHDDGIGTPSPQPPSPTRTRAAAFNRCEPNGGQIIIYSTRAV